MSDGAKSAAAEAAAHDGDRILDHLERGNGLFVARMRFARIRQGVDRVHRAGRDGQGGWVADHGPPIVPLYQAPRVERVGFRMDDPGGLRKGPFVALDLFEARELERVLGRRFGRA